MLLIRGVVVAITVVVSKIDQIGLSSHVIEGGSVNFSPVGPYYVSRVLHAISVKLCYRRWHIFFITN